ncbi:MAG TPA: glutamyl-tRNA reductase, partial [Clostridia bacterium]|nr:glutamyl-tRNA reductase [Clostridia bacterium]
VNQVKNIEILNRSLDKAEALARICQGKPYGLLEKDACLKRADLVVCCTSAADYVLTKEDLLPVLEAKEGKRILLIDIAVPRDVDPKVRELEGVTLFNIDDLQEVIDDNLQARLEAAREAEQIIDKEVDDFFKWLSSLFVVPTIVALKDKAETIKEKELRRALNRLGGSVTEREKKVIGSLANSIVNQILHKPIVNLKAYALTHEGHLYTQILQNLFDLEVEEESSPSLETLAPGDLSNKIVPQRRLHR